MNYRFKIQIKSITKPPVWRRIKVPSHFTFFEFHYAIQIAFNRGNAHLFQFSLRGYASYCQIKQIFRDEEDDSFFMHLVEYYINFNNKNNFIATLFMPLLTK